MFTYCVTFRISDKVVNGKSYGDRYRQLIENIHEEGQGFWDATTSFFLCNSNLDTGTFAARAVKGLSANHDLVVVFDPSDMSMAYFGAVPETDILASFFQTAKKLG